MRRRTFLKAALPGAVGLIGSSERVAVDTVSASSPPGVDWRRTYGDLAIAAVVAAHGGGHLFVGHGDDYPSADTPVRTAVVDESGSVQRRRAFDPNIPEAARRANADLVRTDDGYAVATGSWFAQLDTDCSVQATGFAADYEANSTTILAELSDGFAVAAARDAPNYVSFAVFGFDDDGDLRWTRKFGEQNSKWLHFLLERSKDGLVVGGGSGTPWLTGLASDGRVRWQTEVTDAPSGMGRSAATIDDDGIVLFGGANTMRLTSNQSIDWQRSYTPFRDSNEEQILRMTDGGFLLVARSGFRRIVVGKTNANTDLQWSHEYTVVDDGTAIVNDVIERSPGEYLVVGAKRDGQQGWAIALSDATTPTATPEPTTTPGPTTGPTTTVAGTTATSTTPPSPAQSTTETTTTQPGFGIGAALVGVAAGLLARRR